MMFQISKNARNCHLKDHADNSGNARLIVRIWIYSNADNKNANLAESW